MVQTKNRTRTFVRSAVLVVAAVFIAPSLFAGGRQAKPAANKNEVVVWTYDSFISEWGPGPEAAKLFEEKTGYSVKWVNHGDAGEVLARLLLEGKKAEADIILGIDQNMMDKALGSGLLEAYKPAGADSILSELKLDDSWRLIPFDYSYFAFCYDSQKIKSPPKTLEDLTRPEYAKSVILMDPRTSSPGLGLFCWVREVYGAKWQDYWRRLSPSILTVSGGWSEGYGLFTAGEAPLVLSYTTSPGYHLEYEQTERYQAAIFDEGHPLQVEFAALLGAGKNKSAAKAFLDFLLEPAFQNLVPLTNWMYPVTGVPLPASFRINPKSGKTLLPRPATDAELDEWSGILSTRRGS